MAREAFYRLFGAARGGGGWITGRSGEARNRSAD